MSLRVIASSEAAERVIGSPMTGVVGDDLGKPSSQAASAAAASTPCASCALRWTRRSRCDLERVRSTPSRIPGGRSAGVARGLAARARVRVFSLTCCSFLTAPFGGGGLGVGGLGVRDGAILEKAGRRRRWRPTPIDVGVGLTPSSPCCSAAAISQTSDSPSLYERLPSDASGLGKAPSARVRVRARGETGGGAGCASGSSLVSSMLLGLMRASVEMSLS